MFIASPHLGMIGIISLHKKLMLDLDDIYQQTLENCPEIVRWAFKNQPKHFYQITKIFDIEGSCSNLTRFLKILKLAEELKNANCPNIQEKFAEANTWSKYLSLGSELFFAYEFVKLGYCVSLIPDNSSEWTIEGKNLQSPDLSVERDGQKFLVEVARIKGDETTLDIANQINPIIKKHSFPFRVHIHYSDQFSTPVISYDERNKREQLVENFVDRFRDVIKTIDSNSLPQTKNICDCEVKFSKPYDRQGYYAGCLTGIVIDPAQQITPKIKGQLKEKAQKRIKWNDPQKQLPYLVALDIQQNWFSEIELIRLLFGGLCNHGEPTDPHFPVYSESSIVTKAKENGWTDFLKNVGFNPRSHSYISKAIFDSQSNIYNPERGIFINDSIFNNVTGVITRIRNNLQIVPNPFAEKSINRLYLEQSIPWRSVSDIYKINKLED
jgi:hypothetical protein